MTCRNNIDAATVDIHSHAHPIRSDPNRFDPPPRPSPRQTHTAPPVHSTTQPTDTPFANRSPLHHAPRRHTPRTASLCPCTRRPHRTAAMGLLMSSLWRRLFTFKEFKVCLVGLDNAGKTTILFQLCVATAAAWGSADSRRLSHADPCSRPRSLDCRLQCRCR